MCAAIVLTTAGCGSSDAEVEAEFAEFCEENRFFKHDEFCTKPDTLTTSEKKQLLADRQKIDRALDKFEQESGQKIEEMVQ